MVKSELTQGPKGWSVHVLPKGATIGQILAYPMSQRLFKYYLLKYTEIGKIFPYPRTERLVKSDLAQGHTIWSNLTLPSVIIVGLILTE